ncbi:MAG: hypothetical protein RJA92_1099 [Bacteroidota bacterium]|jgi:uncharacterized protein
MKKLITLLLFVCFAQLSFAQNILPRPNPPKLVNDLAGVLSPEQREILEQKLVALDDSSSNQIAIVLMPTLDGYPIEEYANKLFREWGIGHKGTNNGVLIIAAINDRKVRIEVGYGLEGAIPDVTASDIYNNLIVPAFRDQNYYRGLDDATTALSKAAVGEYKIKKEKKGKSKGKPLFTFLAMLIFILLVVAGGGRGGGGSMSRRGYSDVATGMLLGSLLGGGRSSGGGFGDSGGGFGGFGGGSSGGGGAGGGW